MCRKVIALHFSHSLVHQSRWWPGYRMRSAWRYKLVSCAYNKNIFLYCWHASSHYHEFLVWKYYFGAFFDGKRIYFWLFVRFYVWLTACCLVFQLLKNFSIFLIILCIAMRSILSKLTTRMLMSMFWSTILQISGYSHGFLLCDFKTFQM